MEDREGDRMATSRERTKHESERTNRAMGAAENCRRSFPLLSLNPLSTSFAVFIEQDKELPRRERRRQRETGKTEGRRQLRKKKKRERERKSKKEIPSRYEKQTKNDGCLAFRSFPFSFFLVGEKRGKSGPPPLRALHFGRPERPATHTHIHIQYTYTIHTNHHHLAPLSPPITTRHLIVCLT